MSLINKMLQELDRRHALGAPDAGAVGRQVQVVGTRRRRRDLFWLILGLEVAVAVGWLGWTSYQIRPRPVVTELALQAATKPRHALQPVPQQPSLQAAAPRPVPAPPPSPAPATQEAPTPTPLAVRTLKHAQAIERQVAPVRPRPVPTHKATIPAPKPSVSEPTRDTGPRVEKKEHTRTPAEKAEAAFRQAALLLNQGRVSEAEESFGAALSSDPSHERARQALISLLVDQRRLDEARRLLQEGLAINPAQVQFATVLARIYIENGEYDRALEALRACKGDVSRDAEYNALLGALLQHMSKPKEAADAYRAALSVAPQYGTAWIGLGLSLAALDHHPEAAEAFRRAVATGSLSPQVRDYAERQLQRLQ